jgi:hypothetical protein
VQVPLATPLRLFLGWSLRTKSSSNHNPPRSYSEYDELSILKSYSRSTHTRSANGTPLPSSSSERTPESEGELNTTDTPTSSTPYETARSPSIMSFASLPSIPSLYGTAEVCSTESEATKSVPGEMKASPKVESVSDYITAPVCESEPPSPFATAEVCRTEVSPGPIPGPVSVPVPVPAPPRGPAVAAEPIRGLPITYMDRVFPFYPLASHHQHSYRHREYSVYVYDDDRQGHRTSCICIKPFSRTFVTSYLYK